MSKKVYHLSSCGTCQKIIKQLAIGEEFEYQDIKEQPITATQLEAMAQKTGSYEVLFSKVARKYRGLGLNEMQLTEEDYKKYILEEYTFLKRPVFLINEQIFVGNAPKTIKAIEEALKN